MGPKWKSKRGLYWALFWDWKFFKCPNCNKLSFYAGLCDDCYENLSSEEIDQYEEKEYIKYKETINELKKIIENDDWKKCKYICLNFIRLEE